MKRYQSQRQDQSGTTDTGSSLLLDLLGSYDRSRLSSLVEWLSHDPVSNVAKLKHVLAFTFFTDTLPNDIIRSICNLIHWKEYSTLRSINRRFRRLLPRHIDFSDASMQPSASFEAFITSSTQSVINLQSSMTIIRVKWSSLSDVVDQLTELDTILFPKLETLTLIGPLVSDEIDMVFEALYHHIPSCRSIDVYVDWSSYCEDEPSSLSTTRKRPKQTEEKTLQKEKKFSVHDPRHFHNGCLPLNIPIPPILTSLNKITKQLNGPRLLKWCGESAFLCLRPACDKFCYGVMCFATDCKSRFIICGHQVLTSSPPSASMSTCSSCRRTFHRNENCRTLLLDCSSCQRPSPNDRCAPICSMCYDLRCWCCGHRLCDLHSTRICQLCRALICDACSTRGKGEKKTHICTTCRPTPPMT
jgi:hypothetical protein